MTTDGMDDRNLFLLFLKERGIPEETINYIENENIDKAAIRALSNEKLKEIFPKYGDRAAIIDFCKNTQASRKLGLLEKLRLKMTSKDESKKTESRNSFKKNATKGSRIVELGWLDWDGTHFKQVRTRQGGGTRSKSLKKTATLQEVKVAAENLFFVDGKSTKGLLSEFKTKLLDFKHAELDMDLTIEQMYLLTGLNRIRFYLATEKTSTDVPKKKSNRLKRTHSDSSYDFDTSRNDNYDSDFEEPSINFLETSFFHSRSTVSSGTETTDTAPSAARPVAVTQEELQLPVRDYDIVDLTNCYDFGGKNFILPTLPENAENLQISINRENCVEEMLALYKDSTLTLKKVTVSFIGEEGVDGGGLIRELFNLFFMKVESEYFRGEDVIVPFLPLNKVRKLKDNYVLIGRILEHMILITGSVPSKLSRITFLLIKNEEHIIDDKIILEEFLLYLNPCERYLVQKALNSFSTLCEKEINIIINLFNSYQFYELPTEHEIHEQIFSIAKDVLIEKTKTFIQLIQQGISFEMYADLWSKCDFSVLIDIQRPTPTKIANCLTCSSILTNEETTVLHYLDMYVRCMDQEKLKNFLFFVTGSYQVPEAINISFTKLQGVGRRPLVHTCSNLLQISSQYSSYQDFKNEIDLILINEHAFEYSSC